MTMTTEGQKGTMSKALNEGGGSSVATPLRDNLIARALAFATAAHEGQKRKYTDEPYINHSKAVANMILDQRMADEVVAAALLHDVVEDCNVTLDQIGAEFGPVVRRLVSEVTDISKPEDGNRATRKRIDREHYGRASPDGKSIKLADLIDNTHSIVTRDPGFAKVYLAEKRLLLPLLRDGNEHLFRKAWMLANGGQSPPASSNGRTPGFGPGNGGSTPSAGTTSAALRALAETEGQTSAKGEVQRPTSSPTKQEDR